MAERLRGAELIFAGDFNVDPENTGGRRQDGEISAAVATTCLEARIGHFFPQRQTWCKSRRTWSMVMQWRVVRSQTDYILVSERRIFQNVAVREPRHNSEHLMVIGCLRRASPREHSRYLGHKMRILLLPPGCWTTTRADKIFAELQRAAPKPDKRSARHNSWILAER